MRVESGLWMYCYFKQMPVTKMSIVLQHLKRIDLAWIVVPLALFAHLALVSQSQPAGAQPRSGKELLEFVRDAHKGAREAIRTLSCRVEYDVKFLKPVPQQSRQDFSGQFWYSLDAVRAKTNDRGQETDYVWKDSVQVALHRASEGGKRWASASRVASASRFDPRDAMTLALFALNVPNTLDCLAFEQYVERAVRLIDAERRMSDGKEIVVVRLLFETERRGRRLSSQVAIFFDPSMNYLVRKVEYYNRHEQVTRFREHAPGIFFPEEVVGRGIAGDYVAPARFSDVRVNQPLPKNIFSLTFPYGIVLTDSIRDVKYKVDSLGRPISAEEPYESRPFVAPPQSEQPLGTVTREEPGSWVPWILPASFIVLVAGVVAACVRRWRRKTPGV